MTEKTASVHWEGRGKTGQGQISTETGALDAYPYGFASRFEDNRSGTNPEEILAAAHAACFTIHWQMNIGHFAKFGELRANHIRRSAEADIAHKQTITHGV